ncbi:biotin/lipoate--protein ligase family protein [Salinarimonas sp. NSM]|uniref:biotin/lipoate--protein ligase family protein n=1 Tax=Salinarimonas sp. NSM TaxID=3458003 RepID=UPI004035B64C
MPSSHMVAAAPGLDLPPLFTPVRLRESGDAFAHASAIAAEAEAGAGTFVHVGRYDLVEFAVVLEPEEPLASARRAVFAGMAALADAIAAHCPPEKAVEFVWPDTILYDGALIGGGRLAWPDECAEDEEPAWLVFGAQLIAARLMVGEAGLAPDSTSLEEEGFADPHALMGSFARHLMLHVDAWTNRGFRKVADPYLARLKKEKAGERRGIDGNGDLLVHRHGVGGAERRPLLPGLAACAWYDPSRKGPRLMGPRP